MTLAALLFNNEHSRTLKVIKYYSITKATSDRWRFRDTQV